MSNTDKNLKTIKVIVLLSRSIITRDVDEEIEMSYRWSEAIVTDVLKMKGAEAEIVTKLLNFQKKQRHAIIAEQMLIDIANEPIVVRV